MAITKAVKKNKKSPSPEDGHKMLDRASPIPLHYQLSEHIEGKIRSGKYLSNQKIPTVSELIRTFGVSLPVVQQAMGRLEELGLISRNADGEPSSARARTRRAWKPGLSNTIASES